MKLISWTAFFDLLPVILVILGATVIIILSRTGAVADQTLLASIVALIGVQSISEIINRYRILARLPAVDRFSLLTPARA